MDCKLVDKGVINFFNNQVSTRRIEINIVMDCKLFDKGFDVMTDAAVVVVVCVAVVIDDVSKFTQGLLFNWLHEVILPHWRKMSKDVVVNTAIVVVVVVTVVIDDVSQLRHGLMFN
mmetsp:Transcript_42551/g.134175  ORF Transcript_42551/g.134175 Transcript_42551/m.134175 type:complete len:116 (-) Transcript_42551:205-552(-)